MDDREYCIRMDVCRKRSLYTRCVIFGFMTIFSVFVWLIIGMGFFWPIWVAAAFILTIFVESLQISSFPCVRRWFSFLTPEWEDAEVNHYLNVNCYVTCNPSYSSSVSNISNQTQTTSAKMTTVNTEASSIDDNTPATQTKA